MGVGARIRFDLFQAFIDPIDAILTINHNRSNYLETFGMGVLLRFCDKRLA